MQSSRDLPSWKNIVFNNCSWTLPPWKYLFELIYNFGLHITPSTDFHNSTGWKIRTLVELIFKPDHLTGCPWLFGLYSPSPHHWGFYVSSWPSATSLPSWRFTAYTWKWFHSFSVPFCFSLCLVCSSPTYFWTWGWLRLHFISKIEKGPLVCIYSLFSPEKCILKEDNTRFAKISEKPHWFYCFFSQ